MTIVNEQYTISHLTNDQHKTYYYIPHELRNQDSMNTTPPAVSVALEVTPAVGLNQAQATSPYFVGLNEAQIQMLQQFSVQSRLNFEWSK